MFSRRDRLVRAHLRERLAVTLHDGVTMQGVLLDVDKSHYHLAAVRTPEGHEAAGTMLIPRENVAYTQHGIVAESE